MQGQFTDLQAVSSHGRFVGLRALAQLLDVVVLAIVAIGCYLVGIYWLVDQRRIMPLTLNRMVSVNALLQQQQAEGLHEALIVGSSVVVDGIDCDRIDQQLPSGLRSYNLAWTGAGPQRWLLIESAMRRARPRAAVLALDLTSALHHERIPDDVLAVAGWWDLVDGADIPALRRLLNLDPPRDAVPWVDWFFDREPKPVRLLTSKTEDLLQFRVLPVSYLELLARETLRKDLRYAGHATNLKSPWLRRSIVRPDAMARGVAAVVKQVDESPPEALDRTLEIVAFVTRGLANTGCETLVDFAPVKPEIVNQLPAGYLDGVRQRLAAVVEQAGGTFVDHSELLRDDEFSDHVHAFEPGRLRWSTEVGQELRQRLGPAD